MGCDGLEDTWNGKGVKSYHTTHTTGADPHPGPLPSDGRGRTFGSLVENSAISSVNGSKPGQGCRQNWRGVAELGQARADPHPGPLPSDGRGRTFASLVENSAI